MRRRTAETAAEQVRVIAALEATADTHVAGRLRRCMEAMTSRRQGGGYPWTCRGPGCAWCRIALARRWWRGIAHWSADNGAPVSLAVLPLTHAPGGLRPAVRRLRRSCRDVRDRAARRRRAWSAVAIVGMAAGGDRALLLVRHPPRLGRAEIADMFSAGWPGALVCGIGAAEPRWDFAAEDAAELARLRRGVEPLRIVVLPQRAADPATLGLTGVASATMAVEPMPIAY